MDVPRILSVATANPPNRFTQSEVLALAGYPDERRRGFFLNSGIEGRYLAIERGVFSPDETLDQLQARFRAASVDLGVRALTAALAQAGREPRDLDFLATTTCTGRLCPSLDTLLIRALGLRHDIQRVHVGDTGCASAMVALQQAHNHLRAFPDHLAAVVAVEVSSTSYYLDDDLETAVANAIFADGAGAMLLGHAASGPRVVATRTLLRPEYLDLMGFTFPAGYTAFQFVVVLCQSSMFAGLFTGFTVAIDFESGFARRLMLAAEDRRGIALGYAIASAAPNMDVANAALFLASDEARFITGVLLPVDGGQSSRVG
jgi:predicted naringenin-chalcone synthase